MWISFSKNRYKRNEKLFDESRKTHIDFYRTTIKGRMTNRDTKKSILRKSALGNLSLANSQSIIHNTSGIRNNQSYDQGLFKKK